MQKRHTLLAGIILITLMIAMFISPPVTQAITKVTPTPAPADDSSQPADDVDIETLIEEAVDKLEAEDYEGAIDDFTAIIRVDESLWDAYFLRAFAYAQLGDSDRAIDDYTRALSINPHDWTTYSLRGDLYIRTEELAQANFDYDQALYLNPRYAQAYAGKALLNLRQNDQTLAEIFQGIFEAIQESVAGNINTNIEILTETIENVDIPAPPELGYAYYNRANTYIGQQEWDNALSDMNQAIELQPDMQDYYMGRGFIYSETDRLDRAAPDFYKRMTLVEVTSIDESIDFGETVPIDMAYGTVARLTFSGDAGQQVTLTARDSLGEGVDPLLVLLDVDGNPIAGNDDGGGEFDSLINNFELPESGTYTAVVSHANGGFVGSVAVSLK